MRPTRFALLLFVATAVGWAEDPYSLVRRSIAQNQLDWVRMKDYTWQARSVEKHLDSQGKVESTKRETWETLILSGQPHRRILERDGKPLGPKEELSEQKKLDDAIRKLASETPAEQRRRLAETEKQRRREFAFLAEIPELFDLQLVGDAAIDGRPVWVVSGAPRPGAKARSGDARMLLKLRGRLLIDKATHQWARVEAETTDVISWGLFLARLHPGAKLIFDQTEVNSEIWLPKRLFVAGSGRVGLVKRLAREEEIEWSNYKKFSVDSKIVTKD